MTVNYFSVTNIPNEPIPNSIYLVKVSVNGEFMIQPYFIDDQGIAMKFTNPPYSEGFTGTLEAKIDGVDDVEITVTKGLINKP